jgi:hypothetical protein
MNAYVIERFPAGNTPHYGARGFFIVPLHFVALCDGEIEEAGKFEAAPVIFSNMTRKLSEYRLIR